MTKLYQAFLAEILKNRHAKIIWITMLAFAMAPAFGGVFMHLMKGVGYDGLSGLTKSKAMMMSVEANWQSFMQILVQAMGIGGIIVTGFAVSWVFGREYAQRTVNDLLSLPVSRQNIIHVKFVFYIVWSLLLALSNVLLGLCIGLLLNLPGWSMQMFLQNLQTYLFITLLVIAVNLPIAIFAILGKGYLAPIGIVVLAVVMAQILGALGFGHFFPWAIPGLYSGAAGMQQKEMLGTLNFVIVGLTGGGGYLFTVFYWSKKDHS